MNKINQKKINVFYAIIFLIFFLAAMSVFSLKAYAEEKKLVSLDESKDITIIIGYDTEKPKVAFIAPSGKKYEKDEDFDEVDDTGSSLYYNISMAESGDWNIAYEKGKNKEITVDVVPWHKPISADSFSFETEKESDQPLFNINGKLGVTYDNRYYNYIISAAIKNADGEIVNMFEMTQGSGASGDETEFSVYPDMLPDGEYYLIAEVYAEDSNGTEVHSYIEADKTFVISGNTVEGESDFLQIVCNITDGFIEVSFDSSSSDVRCDEYALMVVQENQAEPIDSQSYSENVFSEHIIFDPADGDVTIQVKARERYGKYIVWKRTFTPEMPAKVSIDTPEITNVLNAVISFDAGEEVYRGRIIIGEKSRELQITGQSKIQAALESMETNELEFQLESENVIYSIKKRISVDDIPPIIDIYGTSGNMTTKEKSVVFVGQTEPSAVFVCNGEVVPLAEDGSFTITKDIKNGENNFCFEASDAAGNSTVRNICITKESTSRARANTKEAKNGVKKLLLTLLISVISAFLIALTAGIVTSKQERKGVKAKPSAVIFVTFMSLVSALFTGFGAWQLFSHFKKKKEVSGANLIELIGTVTDSDIVSLIKDEKAYFYSALISFGIALAGIIVIVVYFVAGKIIRKRKKK